MNLLFLIPYTPTLIRTRPYNLLRGLARRGHHITLATLWENAAEQQALDEFRQQDMKVIAFPLPRERVALNLAQALPSRQPLQARYCWQPALARAVDEFVRSQPVDVVHVEHLRGSAYGLHLRDALKQRGAAIPIVWDSVDCISLLFEQAVQTSRSGFGRWATRFDLPRTRRYEAHLLHAFERVLVTSVRDREALLGLAASQNGRVAPPPERVQVLPNGVDLEYFTAQEDSRQQTQIVFSGKLSYHANVTAALHLAREIMPLVWRVHPQTRLVLAGKDPAPALLELAQAEPRIVVTGTVADLRPYLQQAALAVAPLTYGAGIQNKVLEAMACGTAVAASELAVAALQARPGQDLLVGKNDAALADGIIKLLSDEAQRRRIGKRGRAYVQSWHDWERIVSQLEGIYQEVKL